MKSPAAALTAPERLPVVTARVSRARTSSPLRVRKGGMSPISPRSSSAAHSEIGGNLKLPGPDHPITIERNSKHVRVIFNGHVVAESSDVLTLKEATLSPVFYVPRADADMASFERSAHSTHCPYKGDAAYFSLRVGERVSENAVWTYEEPFPATAQIAGRLAFYRNRVDAIEES